MIITIIDGQGGAIGSQLVKMVIKNFPEAEVVAVGTNSIATANMLKAGAVNAATGENAVVVAARRSDIIVGPIGIVLADALLGEVTPVMATAVGASRAKRILIPMSRCDTLIAGVGSVATGVLLEDSMAKIRQLMEE